MPVVDNVQSGVSSAQSLSVQPESYNEFIGHDPRFSELSAGDNIFAKIGNWITGDKTRAENAYDAYVQGVNKANEERALANARAYDLWLENTRYQRAAADLKAAGLNPWLLVNSGSFSPAGGSAFTNSSAKGVEFDLSSKSTKSGLVALLAGLAKLIAG